MHAGGPIRVMVVDDHGDARFLVGMFLGDHDDVCLVAEAASASEALAAFDQTEPDVAIVDARLPMIDGYELSRRLLALRPGLPIVLLTSSVDEYIREQAAAAGVAAVASKAEFESLPDVVRACVGRSP